MKKLIAGMSAAIAAVSSFAAQPLCYWDQDFSGPQTGGLMQNCTLNLNGRTLSDDKTFVSFNGESERSGVIIRLAESVDKTVGVTVLVAFSDYVKSADAHTVLGSSSGCVAAGVRLSDDLAVPQWYTDSDLNRTSFNRTHFFKPDSAKTNFFAFTHCPQSPGTRGIRFLAYEFSAGSDEGQWVDYYAGSGLTGGGVGNVQQVYVGGYQNDNGNSYMKSPTMKVHGIAVFSGELTADDLATWQFPSMRTGGSADLSWDDDESGAWTATKFGSVDYEKEDYHNVNFPESPSGNPDPVTVTLDGARSVLALRGSAQTRDFTLTGGSVAAKKLVKDGAGRLTVDSPLTVSDQMALNAGELVLPVGYDVENLKALDFSIASDATLGLRSSFISNTNETFALFPAGKLDLGAGSTLELVRLNGMADITTGTVPSITGTGRIHLVADQTEENDVYNILFKCPFVSFNGTVDVEIEGISGKRTRVNLSNSWSTDSYPVLSVNSKTPARAMLVPETRNFGLSALEGNVDVVTAVGGEHKIALALVRDCAFSGGFSSGSYSLILTVSSAEPDKTFTYAGTQTGDNAKLVLTNGATMVLTETAKWTGSVTVNSNATLEIRRAAGALNSAKPLTVDGTLKLACATGVAEANGSEIVFGEDAQLVVMLPDGFFEQKANRNVEFPIVTASTSLTLPAGFEPVIPEGTEIIQVTNEGGDLVGLKIRRKRPGLMLILR